MSFKICVDPGHGEGYNPSPCGFGYSEGTRMYEYSLILIEELNKYFDQNGDRVEVINTRKNIKMSPSLVDRAATAKNCNLLLSNHTNAAGNGIYNGTDYVAVFRSIKDYDSTLADALAKTIATTIGTKQKAQSLTKRNSAGNADYYGIIRHAQNLGVRCLLLEHGFHTDTATTKWFMNDDNLKLLAKNVAAEIAKEYNLTKEDDEMRYNTLADIKADKKYGPTYLPTVEKLIKQGVLKGKGGKGDNLIIDMSEDSVRLLVILDRAGNFK